jgi:hypothetical protein
MPESCDASQISHSELRETPFRIKIGENHLQKFKSTKFFISDFVSYGDLGFFVSFFEFGSELLAIVKVISPFISPMILKFK